MSVVTETKTKSKKLTITERFKKQSTDYYESLHEETKRVRSTKALQLMGHPLYISPPTSFEDSKKFGWMRGLAMLTETFFDAKWHSWLDINSKGELNEDDYVPHYEVDPIFYDPKRPKNSDLGHMLHICLEHVRKDGHDVRELIEWIGWSLGIAWFKKPRLSDKVLKALYTDFVLDLFWLKPSDILSIFAAQTGQSGVLDYFPTPMQVTSMISRMIESEDRMSMLNSATLEPCIGAGAMLLPNKSLVQIGADYSEFMVKVASIQAFIYLPHLLYTPKPILNLHVDKEKMTINRYFEFDTNTRLYNGDSLLGEYRAPKDIFQENSELVDVYFFPVDASKVEWYKLEEKYLRTAPEDMTFEFKKKVTIAQSRLIKIEVGIANPPFNMSLSKYARERIKEIEGSNVIFFKEREERLSNIGARMEISQIVQQEIEIKLQVAKANKKEKVKDGQFAFEF